ncbi:bifunctional non-homologous end joining protein LigD [Saccharopolyspora erythraea NRRL 2338]|uniref:ATP dependent DNA ligase n=2 Tax=Saccharopolyspora erythraea TaxID=1836 RepID=A4FHC5_SACEN|nr:DNA polymerase ligase N-terminal domain-containing protein [Saccharopolyspora erythraea]EQD86855.1 ATP-dependent DNA ligase [Saccharopolyspora erythraea D]PFG97150.1 bifunctional non-homologous end joining protein LigD [Saccharopolyspora erythraea NRRL 2338]QRK87353.1 ATP-dependent DNA ligase [Saccharopolyspora erythraea]CAM03450.1 ATP dependent DNA ligase [Saccharopolyspora erythraea NRRL 2338]
MSSAKKSERLAEYQRKRDFSRTSEPSGREGGARAGGNRFVVQRHRARRRHYDLRLELDGVLLSWAVPKGPTLDPKARHLAVRVEDHPIEYTDFEGVIPEGEYGGGDVIVWDRGTWEPAETDDPAEAIEAGNLHFDLHGEKLGGRFVLVRRGDDDSGKEQWLLLHKKDEHAEAGWTAEDHLESVKSGRTNEEVAAAPEAMWRSDLPASEAEVPVDGAPAGKSGRSRSGERKTARSSGAGSASSDKASGKASGTGSSSTRSSGKASGTGSSGRASGSSSSSKAGSGTSKKAGTKPAKTREKSGAKQRSASARRSGRKTDEEKSGGGRDERPRWDPPSEEELAALDELGAKGPWEVGGRRLALTNLDKVLFPGRDDEPPVTKRDFVRYHARIGPVILPYLVGRPLNTHRYPDGADKPGFWHKEVPSHAPYWLTSWRYEAADPDETQNYVIADSVPALAWLANYAALELHPWTSWASDVEHPTWALFDIDPGSKTSFEDVLALARLHRTALEHLGVRAGPKVTGQRGVQIWVPIAPHYTYEETRRWVEKVSKAIGATVPDLVSWAWQKNERRGLARLDYTQNVVNKTLVAPYSARPRPGAPVSVPISWDELDDPDLTPDRWTVRTVFDRLDEVGDPLAPLVGLEQELPPIQ